MWAFGKEYQKQVSHTFFLERDALQHFNDDELFLPGLIKMAFVDNLMDRTFDDLQAATAKRWFSIVTTESPCLEKKLLT